MVSVGVGVVRGSKRAAVNAAVGRGALEVTTSSQAIGFWVTLVTTGAPTSPHIIPFVAVAVAPTGSSAGECVTTGVTRVRAI